MAAAEFLVKVSGDAAAECRALKWPPCPAASFSGGTKWRPQAEPGGAALLERFPLHFGHWRISGFSSPFPSLAEQQGRRRSWCGRGAVVAARACSGGEEAWWGPRARRRQGHGPAAGPGRWRGTGEAQEPRSPACGGERCAGSGPPRPWWPGGPGAALRPENKEPLLPAGDPRPPGKPSEALPCSGLAGGTRCSFVPRKGTAGRRLLLPCCGPGLPPARGPGRGEAACCPARGVSPVRGAAGAGMSLLANVRSRPLGVFSDFRGRRSRHSGPPRVSSWPNSPVFRPFVLGILSILVVGDLQCSERSGRGSSRV